VSGQDWFEYSSLRVLGVFLFMAVFTLK